LFGIWVDWDAAWLLQLPRRFFVRKHACSWLSNMHGKATTFLLVEDGRLLKVLSAADCGREHRMR